jgi:malate synthase
MSQPALDPGVLYGVSLAAVPAGSEHILSDDALAFVADLVRLAAGPRAELLREREAAAARWDGGELPGFLSHTAAIREGDWRAAALPADLLDRRVEITGPVDRKMVINALNSGANVFMADFEDATSPTWHNVVMGQVNLYDAARRTIRFHDPTKDKHYALCTTPATLMVRPRGWHLIERNMTVDGEPVPASIFDFALFLYHNACELLARGSGPYFYLPKLQTHTEARLWNQIFVRAQQVLGLPLGTIKATVLLETLPAAFEMEEILYELREHSAGLNCGRWDYIFSYIKTVRSHPDRVLPDRAAVGMGQPFMRAYTQQLIRICHKRGVHAMGGMAAQIPNRHDHEANEAAFAAVRADKIREAESGHDGTWVAHPGLVATARAAFDAVLGGRPNQLDRARTDAVFTAEALLESPIGPRTEEGLRLNIRVGVQYIEAWLRGSGCVPLYGKMEDAATAEISRAAVWQMVRHGATLDDGSAVTTDRVHQLMVDELAELRGALGTRFLTGRFDDAAELFADLSTSAHFVDFLTIPAYDRLN